MVRKPDPGHGTQFDPVASLAGDVVDLIKDAKPSDDDLP